MSGRGRRSDAPRGASKSTKTSEQGTTEDGPLPAEAHEAIDVALPIDLAALEAKRDALEAEAKERAADALREEEADRLLREIAHLERVKAIADLGDGRLSAGADLGKRDKTTLPDSWRDPRRHYFWARKPRTDDEGVEAGTIGHIAGMGYRIEKAPGPAAGVLHQMEQGGHVLMSCSLEEKAARDAALARQTRATKGKKAIDYVDGRIPDDALVSSS